MGNELSLIWVLPFAGMLLSIALFPLFAPHFWHHHFAKVSVGWALVLAIPFVALHRQEAMHDILHVFIADYIPFLILLGALFTVSGGILLHGTLIGTPFTNAVLLTIGTFAASWIGTTGASMLLIRPLIKANAARKHKTHTIVFFIFVSNIGGSLTPLGDPPLFLGFLNGVPFLWTLEHMWRPMVVATGAVMAIYLVVDYFLFAGEGDEARALPDDPQPIGVSGKGNFVLLLGIVAGVVLSGYWKPSNLDLGVIHQGEINILGVHVELQNLARDLILVLMALVSLAITPKAIREANGFSWGPIREVAWLFAGIFMTIIPALAILKAGEHGALAFLIRAVREPAHYFWASGLLSSVLDNAPTYLTFMGAALGRFQPDAVPVSAGVAALIAEQNVYLVAIACGSVFMGANTYIGNAPNFMVKSIAEEANIRMPDFFSYIFKYSLPVLGSTFVLITLLFFMG